MSHSDQALVNQLNPAARPSRKIAPCPFSPRTLIDEADAWKSLGYFCLYRLVVAGLIVALFLNDALPPNLEEVQTELFAPTAFLYLGAVLVAGILVLLRRPDYASQAQTQVFVDIALLPLVIHAAGGLSSGAGVLLGLSVAAGGFLVGGRCAILFAALASLAVLAEAYYMDQRAVFASSQLTYGGLLGASYFGIAFLALQLASRLERSEAVAEQRGADVTNLRQINEFIIRNLQSGVLVVGEDGRIRLINDSAARLVPAAKGRVLREASPALAGLFLTWLADPRHQTLTLEQDGLPDIHVGFTRLGQTGPPLYMITLEDSARYNRRVQLSKLASLGRLTASIAHEIRNPLGAISHASQLLAESPAIQGQDARLTQIILDHVSRLNRVIENVLQISRRDEARREVLRLETTLSKFLEDFVADHGLEASAFRLESLAGDPEVAFDLSHLRQIMDNLCANALKYGHPELGPITVRIIRRFGKVCIEMVDHAPAIDPETARNLFEPFFTTAPGGTGLGLYIARELAELNQARMEYADAGEGSCFRLSMSDAKTILVEL